MHKHVAKFAFHAALLGAALLAGGPVRAGLASIPLGSGSVVSGGGPGFRYHFVGFRPARSVTPD